MSVKSRRKVYIPWLLVLMSIAVLATPAMAAYANGRVVRFDRRIAGPYEIAVGTIPESPVVGSLHLTMSVTDTATDTFILDAEIIVTGTGPESDAIEIGPLTALNNPTDLAFYDANTSVDRVGVWVFTVSVNSDLGDASTEFPVEVKSSSPLIGIVTLVALVAFTVVLGFSIRSYLRERSRSRRRRA